jgi:hypothetical protein
VSATTAGFVAVLSLVVLATSGCGGPHAKEGGAGHAPLTERIARAAPQDPSGRLTSEEHLGGVKRVLAKGIGDLPPFYVSERTGAMRRVPCGECHTESLGRLKAQLRKDKKAHWEIELRHAGEQTMVCATCHAGGKMESLTMLNGQAVGFDHAYQVCAQCHANQVKDWASGAHGKRLGGWAPPRVVENCAGCHNPHQPKLEKRWPSRSSRLLIERR